jgi:arginase
VLLGALVAAGHRADAPAGLLAFCGRECATPPSASPTGEAADCTIGLALVAQTDAALSGGLSRRLPLLSPPAVALLGPRDASTLAASEVPSLAGSILIRSDEEMAADRTPSASAIGRHATEAGEHIRRTAGSWWLHVDLDVLSADVMPHVNNRRPGGLSWEQLTALTRNALGQPGLIGWSVTSYNPDLDLDRESAAHIVDYIATCVSALPKSPALPAPKPLTAPMPAAEPEAQESADDGAEQRAAHEAVHEAQLSARHEGQHAPVPSS